MGGLNRGSCIDSYGYIAAEWGIVRFWCKVVIYGAIPECSPCPGLLALAVCMAAGQGCQAISMGYLGRRAHVGCLAACVLMQGLSCASFWG